MVSFSYERGTIMTTNAYVKDASFSVHSICAAIICASLRKPDPENVAAAVMLIPETMKQHLFEKVIQEMETTCVFNDEDDLNIKSCKKTRKISNGRLVSKVRSWINEKEPCGDHLPEELMYEWEALPSLSLNGFNIVTSLSRIITPMLEKEFRREVKNNKIITRENELKKLFNLRDDDIILLKIAYAYDCDAYNIQNVIKNDMQGNSQRFFNVIAKISGLSSCRVRTLLSKDARLIKCGIIKDIPKGPNSRGQFDMNEEVMGYIDGTNGRDSLLKNFVSIDECTTLPINSFMSMKKDTEMLTKILKDGSAYNILFHGEPGTGKTEYARTLIRAAGMRPLFVNHKVESMRWESSRQAALQVALNVASENDVIVVDEADQLLNTKSFFFSSPVEKGWLNDFIDSAKTRMIWITNRTNGIDDSHLRRFTYNVRFEKFNALQRENIWKEILAKSVVGKKINDRQREYLAETYSVNAAGIANAVDVVEKLYKKRSIDTNAIMESLEKMLSPHEELITGKKSKMDLNPLVSQYDPEAVNIDTPVDRVIASLKKVARTLKEYDKNDQVNANLLFYGLPGTGKTEFAKHLGKTLGMKILFKRCSDLETMWVGETEKNIARAFREAEESGKILFIDEADTFFTDRSAADRSWEISRTNEMLTQMENFRGIFICCTNMKNLLDSAAIRRFGFKMHFKPLRKEQRVPLYKKYFGNAGKINLENTQRVDSLENLTPGDVRAVYNNYQYSNPEEITHEAVIQELEREVSHKNNDDKPKVGF